MHKILPRRTAFNKWTNEANAGKKDCCPIDNWGSRQSQFVLPLVLVYRVFQKNANRILRPFSGNQILGQSGQRGPNWPKRSKITGRSKNFVSQHRTQIPVSNLFWDNVMYYAVRRRQADSVEHCLNSIALHTLVVCAISSLNIAFFLCSAPWENILSHFCQISATED